MMRQGIDTLEIDQMAAPQAQGIETLGTMEDAPMIPNGGIQGAVPEATEMLAAAGREGDIYVVHASEGDTVIPEEVLAGEGGAQIREMLFRQMEQMGVDPQRYVVGSELNSINPETGLPEFFFKKIFKSIKKIFKKVAPIVLPIVLSLIPGLQPLGAVALGALGSGLGTLIQGGDAKDALKAAAFGGITAGITSGLAGGIAASKAGGDFFSGFGTGIQASVPFLTDVSAKSVPNIFQAITGEAGTFAPSGAFRPKLDATASLGKTFDKPALIGQSDTNLGRVRKNVVGAPPTMPRRELQSLVGSGASAEDILLRQADIGSGQMPLRRNLSGGLEFPGSTPEGNRQILEAMNQREYQEQLLRNAFKTVPERKGNMFSDYLFRAGEPENVQAIEGIKAYNAALDKYGDIPYAKKLGLAAYDKAKPSLAARFLPSTGLAAAGLVGLNLAGAFEAEQDPFQSQARPIDQSLVRQARLFNEQDPIRAPANPPIQFSQINPAFASFPTDQVRFTAHGGEMQNFPPRIGAIAGPGTEKSDDVPAMLSDGEFVMTAQAVRGAGNGSRRQGVKNLYDIMRNFEAVA